MCFDAFAEAAPWDDLPLSCGSLGDLAFTLLIPVLEKLPSKGDSCLISVIQSQIPAHALKSLRLISFLIRSIWISSTSSPYRPNFLFCEAPPAIPRILASLIRRLPSSEEARFRRCIAGICHCLRVQDRETLHIALSILIKKRPPVVPADPSLILALLFQAEYREKVLRLLNRAREISVACAARGTRI
jgi:hypothetical protein